MNMIFHFNLYFNGHSTVAGPEDACKQKVLDNRPTAEILISWMSNSGPWAETHQKGEKKMQSKISVSLKS